MAYSEAIREVQIAYNGWIGSMMPPAGYASPYDMEKHFARQTEYRRRWERALEMMGEVYEAN
jgi:hypothetical protein